MTTFVLLGLIGLVGLWGLETLLVLFSLRSSLRTEGPTRPRA